jgi:hypothetical protein
MKKLVRRYLPPALQSLLRRAYYRSRLARKIYYFPQDCAWVFFKSKDGMRPPRSLISVGDGNFEQIGREYMGHFIQLGGLKPHEQVLEIGCGIGRMAIPLTAYLNDDGRYEGFDIVRPEIRWRYFEYPG